MKRKRSPSGSRRKFWLKRPTSSSWSDTPSPLRSWNTVLVPSDAVKAPASKVTDSGPMPNPSDPLAPAASFLVLVRPSSGRFVPGAFLTGPQVTGAGSENSEGNPTSSRGGEVVERVVVEVVGPSNPLT